jgi:hypothetical protein
VGSYEKREFSRQWIHTAGREDEGKEGRDTSVSQALSAAPKLERARKDLP